MRQFLSNTNLKTSCWVTQMGLQTHFRNWINIHIKKKAYSLKLRYFFKSILNHSGFLWTIFCSCNPWNHTSGVAEVFQNVTKSLFNFDQHHSFIELQVYKLLLSETLKKQWQYTHISLNKMQDLEKLCKTCFVHVAHNRYMFRGIYKKFDL